MAEIGTDLKINYLKCMLVELLKKTKETELNKGKEEELIEFDLQFALSLDKLILFPFFLSTANGEETRNTMFTKAFTVFASNKNGVFEKDIKEGLLNLEDKDNKFFKIYDLSDDDETDLSSIFLFPNWKEINNFKSDNNCSDNSGEVNDKILKHCVKHILQKHPKFLYYTIDELRNLSYHHQSWSFLNLKEKEENTNLQSDDYSFEKDLFVTQYSPLTPSS